MSERVRQVGVRLVRSDEVFSSSWTNNFPAKNHQDVDERCLFKGDLQQEQDLYD